MPVGAFDKPNTHDMVIVHRVFRREFRLLPDLVAAVRPGDTVRAGFLADHLAGVVTALHHHHHGEDELLWPKLLERATLHTELVERMEAQHETLAAALDQIDQLLPKFRADAAPDVRDRLAETLREASGVLEQHLAEEEREILPITEEHLTADEWSELGKRGAGAIPKDKLLIFLGMILEDADPAERKEFLGPMPWMAKVMWALVGRRKYAAYVAQLRTA